MDDRTVISPDGLWRWSGAGWVPNHAAVAPPPPPWAAPPSGRRMGPGREVAVALAAVVALAGLVAARVALAGAGRPAVVAAGGNAVSAGSEVAAGQGPLRFSDDFHDTGSGWLTGTLSGTSSDYRDGGFAVTPQAESNKLFRSPDGLAPLQQLGMRAQATLGDGAGSGFGVACRSGARGASEVRYEFLVVPDGAWFVERGDGAPTLAVQPRVLREGPAGGAVPRTVEAVCATLADNTLTRLVMFVDGRQVANLVDGTGAAASAGWSANLLVAGGASPAPVVVGSFAERDPSR